MEIALSGDDMDEINCYVQIALNNMDKFSDEEGDILNQYVDVVVKIALPGTDHIAGEVRWHGDGYWAYFPRGEQPQP